MPQRLAALFNLRSGEGQPLLLLFVVHFCIASSIVFTNTAAYALFLESFDTQQLPYMYIAVAIVVSLLTTLYLRITQRQALSRLILLNVLFLAGGSLVFRAGLEAITGAWFVFTLPIWYQILNNLGNLTLWTAAGTLFDVRQGKRLFGLVNAGAWVASAASGFLVSPLVGRIGTPNLFVLAAVMLLLGAGCLLILVRRFGAKLQGSADGDAAKPKTSLGQLLRVRYIALLFLMLMLWYIGYFFIDNIFYDRATLQFPDTDALAAFLGSFFGVIGILGLIVDVFITSRVIGRYGLRGAYLIMPIGVSLCAAGIALTGTIAGEVAALFWLATLAKLLNYGLGSSIETSAYTLFYQPLPADQQVRARALADGIVQPFAVGIAGILLVIFNTLLGFGAVKLSFIFLIFAAAWLTVLFLVTREYPVMLMRVLNRRLLGQTPLPIVDATALNVIERGLSNPHPAAALYSLNLLEQVEGTLPERSLPVLLSHPAPEVREETLRRLERLDQKSAQTLVRQRLDIEPSPQVKSAALRTLAVLGESEAIPTLLPYLESSELEARQGAIVGLLRSGDPESSKVAGQSVNALRHSALPQERILAAQILGEVGAHSLYEALWELLNDADVEVRRAALLAAGKVRHPGLWPLMIDALAAKETRQAAAVGLISGGQEALAELRTAFLRSDAKPSLLIELAHIAARIGGTDAANLLSQRLNVEDTSVRGEVLRALTRIGFRADGNAAQFQAQLQAEVGYAAWLLATIGDIGTDRYTSLLCDALNDALEATRSRIFYLLAFLYGTEAVFRARDTLLYGAESQHAYALEVLDTLIAQGLKRVVLPLLDNLTPSERMARLNAVFPQPPMTRPERLTELIDSPRVSDWIRACALYTAGTTLSAPCKFAVLSAVESSSPVMRETALWAKTRLARSVADTRETLKLTKPITWGLREDEGTIIRRRSMFSTIEKVILLKTIVMFSETPDEALTEIAMLLQEQDFAPEEPIVTKGDPGSSMYIIVSGRVRVHDGTHTFNTLGDNEVFGELALLDSEPRSASVTAVEPTHVFKLEQEPFYELMQDRSEVARGIIQMLVTSLRARVGELRALNKTTAEFARSSE